ncbi:hypothetical protein FFLO_06042 [Filobasidium floriforme]|uniref:Prefoldin subunit 2 n=1 Tax=Filobasidium floriforme TaxID=5210 RepID=A0A8K0JI03_9TREE|nr:Prefoldin beta-like protein [Filobasidium floriforme]KAG7528619.1 hypothetical protein FFLO_06042 [Filobasidium floriforme]KAH8087283.1 Prefoldin beta-like protein [Filobasidium floriforme]
MSAKAPPKNAQPAPADVQARYTKYKNELTALAQKMGELEQEGEEHDLVLSTLTPLLKTEPTRKCFRLIGGVLVERTVSEVEPDLKGNLMGIQNALEQLVQTYKTKEDEFQRFQKDFNIQARDGRP